MIHTFVCKSKHYRVKHCNSFHIRGLMPQILISCKVVLGSGRTNLEIVDIAQGGGYILR